MCVNNITEPPVKQMGKVSQSFKKIFEVTGMMSKSQYNDQFERTERGRL